MFMPSSVANSSGYNNNECMAKRKLSKRQAWRVKKIQDERTERAHKRDADLEQQLSAGELGPEQQGLIIAHFGVQVEVESENGERVRCHLRANLDSLVTGDQVIWRNGEPTGVVVACLERNSVLKRPDNHGEIKAVAANISRIIIVISPQPTPHANLIDRYLVAAEAVNIEPIILLNKYDLIDDAGSEKNRETIEAMLSVYPPLGYQLINASIKSHSDMEELLAELAQHTSVFVGQSGVGKSSLVNTLLPGEDLRTGPLSDATGKGQHTTTTARLFHLPSGGQLIDSPGIREFGLWHMQRQDIEDGFREFHKHLGHCKFRDCKHQQEPGCALLEALENGDISEQRMASYEQMIASIEA